MCDILIVDDEKEILDPLKEMLLSEGYKVSSYLNPQNALDFLDKTNVDAVAAANIFHYIDQSVFIAKKYLHDAGYNFRRPDLIKIK